MLEGMHSDRSRRFRQYLPLLKMIAVVTLFAVALRALQDTLAQYSLRQIAAYLHALPNSEILLAIALTLFGYLVMTGYDTLAFHHVRHPFPYKKIALASFIGYAFNNSLGMSGLVGGSLRYRLYNAWRLTTGEIARVIAFCTISFWLGFVLLGGFIFLFDPPAAPALLHIPFGSMRILGAALLVPAIAYLIGIAIRREPVKVRDWEFKLPSPRIFVAQAAISMLDWTVAASCSRRSPEWSATCRVAWACSKRSSSSSSRPISRRPRSSVHWSRSAPSTTCSRWSWQRSCWRCTRRWSAVRAWLEWHESSDDGRPELRRTRWP